MMIRATALQSKQPTSPTPAAKTAGPGQGTQTASKPAQSAAAPAGAPAVSWETVENTRRAVLAAGQILAQKLGLALPKIESTQQGPGGAWDTPVAIGQRPGRGVDVADLVKTGHVPGAVAKPNVLGGLIVKTTSPK